MIVVIGAGIIGASIAWRLAQQGLQTTLVDAGSMGGEASWAGAGMLAPGGEFDRLSPSAAFALESLGLYRAFVDELRAESGADIDYQELGAVELAFDTDEWDQLQARASAQGALGIPSEPLTGARLSELLPLSSRDVAGALYFARDALVDPCHVMHALRLACARRGVGIYEHRPVMAVRVEQDAIAIESAAGNLQASAVVIAAGAWSADIPVWHEGTRVVLPRSFPVKGHLLGYRLAAGSLGPLLRQGHTYLLQRSNGFTIAGSSEERIGFDRSIDQHVVADIHERACRLLPCLQGVPYEPWIGFRPGVEGLAPAICRLGSSNIWLSYGHYRNGILLAPATALRVSREMIASWETGPISRGERR